MGSRPAQQKEAHVPHIWFHCNTHTHLHTSYCNVCAPFEKHYIVNIIKKAKSLYKAFSKASLQVIQVAKTSTGLPLD